MFMLDAPAPLFTNHKDPSPRSGYSPPYAPLVMLFLCALIISCCRRRGDVSRSSSAASAPTRPTPLTSSGTAGQASGAGSIPAVGSFNNGGGSSTNVAALSSSSGSGHSSVGGTPLRSSLTGADS